MLTKDSIVVGIDVHKYSHKAVALDCLGQQLSELSFTNEQLSECGYWLNNLGALEDVVIGLEDTKGVGIHLSNYLKQQGFKLQYVPAILTQRERKQNSTVLGQISCQC